MNDPINRMPCHWKVGDSVMHRDGGQARRRAQRSPFVTIVAIKATNKHANRFRVDWTTLDGEHGHFHILNQFPEYIIRPA